ncbi:hypothetical protein [Pseudomonas sp. bs2935]|uniref:hypothetical protein n=1 Tax=Pseudomonas sp. bs2935 TaxID=1761895 RepID=UPI000879AA52|nr:hypothetical protein [Pseudomonas sp. bs2935]SDS34315.1 hypothetical protein SAMN04490210_2236 [Pseudomonas sp. bs2935]
MTDYTELKRLAEACVAAGEYLPGEAWEEARSYGPDEVAFLEFAPVATPAAVLVLLDDIATLKAGGQLLVQDRNDAWTERDQLRAEVAGLKTGYEAYERVNAELKAENEALRDDLEQIQYDANAWRNSEESVWIEVFNSEGDDPFISAISGQITVEQLALIQAEIIEYREDYFEKGSGLYVFRCAHYQAHHDNVGMTEPAHWETDFESYSPFPWEDEAAAMGKGGQS